MTIRNTVSKFSISIPADLAKFVEQYQASHGLENRSEVIARGLQSLRDAELAAAYRAHAEAWSKNPEKDFWDKAAVDDGLDTEESKW
jgi:Arc/MetJ-type ribon-helix-helix transcriptional regulator